MITTGSLAVPAQTRELNTVLDFICARLDAAGCPPDTREIIAIAVEEIFVNIAHYAYGEGGGTAWLRCDIEGAARRARIELSDAGIPYDPLQRPDPDITLAESERPVGGLGIYMVKTSMDSVGYERKDGKNVLVMTKTF